MNHATRIDTLWMTFLEATAKTLSSLLTDHETEQILNSFQKFSARVRELSSHNLRQLQLEQESKRPFCRHAGRCRSNCLRGFLRAFAASAAVKYAVSILQYTFTGQLRRRPSLLVSALFDRDLLRFALFFGTFIASFKGVNCLLRKFRQREDHWNGFIAGSLAGTSLLLDSPDRRVAVMLYLGARSAQCAFYALIKQGLIPIVPHGETWIFALLNIQIIYAFMCEPNTLARSYYKWIYDLADLKHHYGVRHAKAAMQSLTSIANRIPVPSNVLDPILDKSRSILQLKQSLSPWQRMIESVAWIIWSGSKGSRFALDSVQTGYKQGIESLTQHRHQFCAIAHPDSRCFPKAFRMCVLVIDGYLHSLKPKVSAVERVHVVTLATRPTSISGSMRSSVFISLFAALAWVPPCYGRHLCGQETRLAMVAIEYPSSRRVELVLYCLPRAVESAWNMAKDRGIVRAVPAGEVALFSMAMGYLMMLYQNDQEIIPSGIRRIFVSFFGNN